MGLYIDTYNKNAVGMINGSMWKEQKESVDRVLDGLREVFS